VNTPLSNGLVVVPFSPEEVAFFFPVPQMDAHENQEEQARPCGNASLPASPRAFSVSYLFFSLPFFSDFRVRVPAGGDAFDGDFLLGIAF
jgi:hypothetical protein